MIAAKTQLRGVPVQILGQVDLSTLTPLAKAAYNTGTLAYNTIKSGGQAGTTATTTTKTTDPYARCAKLTVPLARSQCMAQVGRELSLRTVGQQQVSMGPAKIPASSATNTVVTVGIIAAIGAAVWFLL